MSRVGARRKDNVLWGKVNGVAKRILVDTGAEVGMIPRSLVGRDAIDCGDINIRGVLGVPELHKSTKAIFEVAGLRLEKEVMIDESGDPEGECILPLSLSNGREVMK